MSQGDTTAMHTTAQRKQQRQILQMMGITQWVRPDAPVLALADIHDVVPVVPTKIASDAPVALHDAQTIDSVEEQSDDSVYQNSSHAQAKQNSPSKESAYPQDNANNSDTDDYLDSTQLVDNNDAYEYSDEAFADSDFIGHADSTDTIYHFDSLDTDSSAVSYNESMPEPSTAYKRISAAPDAASQQKIAAFDLQGGCYKGWVLMVDVRALTAETKTLWQNITQALSISCENNAFPLCPDMNTLELADASVAGFVFRLGRQEQINVAALTALPEGVSHPNLHSLPTLETMLTAPEQKRVFWQRINT